MMPACLARDARDFGADRLLPVRGKADAAPTTALWVVFEQSSTPAALLDEDLRILRGNRALAALLGRPVLELNGLAMAEFCRWQRSDSQNGDEVELDIVRDDGGQVPATGRLCAVPPGDGAAAAFVLTVEDRSVPRELERLRQEAATATRHVQLARAFLDGANEAVVVHEMDRTIRYWSAAAERMFGYTHEQARGSTYAQLLGPKAALTDEQLQSLIENGTWRGEMTCEHASGHLLRVERHYRIVQHGDCAAVFTMNIDLGERHRAEKESMLVRNLLEQRLKAQTLQLRESMEEMRDFSYSIAHDLRAPLTAIQGFGALLQKRLASQLDATSEHYFDRLRAGTDALNAMTQSLETLARLSHTKLVPRRVAMDTIAQRIVQELRGCDRTRRVAFTVDPMPPAIADLALATNLLEHLLGNAWKFTAGTPCAAIAFSTKVAESGACVYSVADNGVGFDGDYAYKLFSPFQRLHSPHEFPGSGMGLALARKIVARHGGRIWAESSPGRGTTVFFTFHDPEVLKVTLRRTKIAEDMSGRWSPPDTANGS